MPETCPPGTPTSPRSAARSARAWSTCWPRCTRSTRQPWAWSRSAVPTATSSARSPLGQAVGRHPHRGPRRARRARRRPGRPGPDDAAAHRRARRLPARQHAARRRPTPGASLPSWTGRCRRSATRWPTSAILLVYWSQADDSGARTAATVVPAATVLEGFPTRAEVADRYAAADRSRPDAAALVRRVRLLQARRRVRRHRRAGARRARWSATASTASRSGSARSSSSAGRPSRDRTV